MNDEHRYNFLHTQDLTPDDNDIISPYVQYNITSPYYDMQTLSAKLANHTQPIFLSLNTQSLLSKHESIKILLSDLASKNIHIDILALQETWRIPYLELVQIPGYHFLHKHRASNRGGGVGFYIRDTITYKHLPDLSPFTDNVLESITIEAKIHKHTYLLSSIYRSPNKPRNMSPAEQITAFNTQLDTLLSSLNTKKLNTYVFLDSNLNLLHIDSDNSISGYHDLILATSTLSQELPGYTTTTSRL